VHKTPEDRVARGLVAAGGVVAFTTDAPGLDGGVNVVAIDGTPLTVQFRVCRGAALPAAAERLLDVLQSVLAADAGPDRATGVPRPATGLPTTTRLLPAAA
jgi:hypothetical protein